MITMFALILQAAAATPRVPPADAAFQVLVVVLLALILVALCGINDKLK